MKNKNIFVGYGETFDRRKIEISGDVFRVQGNKVDTQ